VVPNIKLISNTNYFY